MTSSEQSNLPFIVRASLHDVHVEVQVCAGQSTTMGSRGLPSPMGSDDQMRVSWLAQ